MMSESAECTGLRMTTTPSAPRSVIAAASANVSASGTVAAASRAPPISGPRRRSGPESCCSATLRIEMFPVFASSRLSLWPPSAARSP